jgi:hypothetical protein
MQDVALEVESNILVVDRLRRKADSDRGTEIFEASTFGSFASYPTVYELTKMVKSMFAKMEKIKFKGKKGYKNVPNTDNRGIFRRLNNNDP